MSRIRSLLELKQSGIKRFRKRATGEVKHIHTIDIRGRPDDVQLNGSVVVVDQEGNSTEVDAQKFHNWIVVEAIEPLSKDETADKTLDSFKQTPARRA